MEYLAYMKYSNIVILWKTSYAENFPSICRERARKKKEEEERRMEREREKVWFQLYFYMNIYLNMWNKSVRKP